MSPSPGGRSEDGATIAELLVASFIGLAVVAILAGAIVPAIGAIEVVPATHGRTVELTNAIESVAGAVRAARPSLGLPAVEGGADRLELRRGRDPSVHVVLSQGELRVAAERPVGTEASIGVLLVDGLDMDASGFVLLGSEGTPVDGPDPVVAVAITLSDGAHEVTRLVATRNRTALDRVSR